ncbi:trifunctional serine/threonine-protein kinase/ATP-binding protein/sensor histidine kinase [Dapis sp. BLCC M172]|uniref:trifunctional serine/threonine-protein kinase/ATP-binding protein/sensor histidine kinase n=1 Tax=Dapis sp. BLCC M172 TaxID=2975281 RepID=UPI003CF72E72
MNLTITSLSNYKIGDLIYESEGTVVYRAVTKADSQPVVIKLLRNDYPSFNELVKFRNQYTIASNLHIEGIVKPLALERYQNSYALIMEDFGGISLAQNYQNLSHDKKDISQFLDIAIQIAEIVYQLHQNRIIHKDIKPANILINPQTKEVKIIDFSISTLLPKETQTIQNYKILEGTLAYISPEQTGRMNRGIDYRSDFYSLGVTFFEMLNGVLPFETKDPMELVHCHLAKMPVLGSREGETQIPEMLMEIVMKLMAKNAEDRYQSALGLKYDLEKCRQEWEEKGEIENFELGERDISDRFLIPEKLYGREAEVEQLLAAFDRVAAPPQSSLGKGGGSEIILVAGFSGIGKTVVVNEVHKPIVRRRGYFIKGKFDQFNRNIPFSALVQALRDLMEQILSESDAQLQEWKSKILEAVGENGQVIIEVIPKLEKIIGKQPAVAELSGSARQNRFNLLFGKFIQVFATQNHPLVIFIDDLQWADSASLNLLQLLMSKGEKSYLLFIGAYRDNEVFPAHPLMLTLEEIAKEDGIINTITLSPLSQNHINLLVSETLSCTPEVAQPLTELIYQKTKGNPFFTTQFMLGLHGEGLIQFNTAVGYWECDIAQVRQMTLTDDVVEFMAGRLQKLPKETQQVLKLAACIGNQFNLQTLAVVCEQSEADTADNLWKALQLGLILPQTEVYKFYLGREREKEHTKVNQDVQYRFLHDRVQQAAYTLIPENQKQLTHLKIGQLLLQKLSPDEKSEQIFALVNQLNLGRAAIFSLEEKQKLADLNLEAGKKAKLSAAYQVAENYFTIGINLLPITAWQNDYELIYSLHHYGSEAAYLCGNFAQAELLYTEALNHAQTALDKAVIYRIQMTQYQLQGRNSEAIAIQRQSLLLLGWEIPIEEKVIQVSLDEEIAKVKRFIQQQTVASILKLPKMKDENMAEMLRISQILFYAAWLDGQPTLAFLALAKMTTLSLENGNSDMSPFGYVGYGLVVNAMLKDATTAYKFGDMAVQLCEQFDNADVRGMTNFLFAADVHSWSRPIREADTYYENAYKYGMEAGNWLTVGFMMMQSGSDRLTYGKNLSELYTIAKTHADFLRQVKSLENLDALIVGVVQPIRNLLGLTKTIFTFDDDDFSESKYLQKYSNTPYHLSWLYSVKIRHAYLFNNQAAYPDLITKLDIIENTIASHAKVPSSVFYVALMHITLAETTKEEKDYQFHLEKLISLEEKLNTWQNYCPENILHKCLIIQAEKARLNGQKTEAIDLYEQAITTAQTNQYDYEEALAQELLAKLYLDWSKEKIACIYMQEAYYCYARWGAKAKTDDLEKHYPQLLKPILERQKLGSLSSATFINLTQGTISQTTIGIEQILDLATLMKASRTLSEDISLNGAIANLMEVVRENAGAETAVLMLFQDQKLILKSVVTGQEIFTPRSVTVATSHAVPLSVVNKVKRNQKPLVIDNASNKNAYAGDTYIQKHQPKSVLCLPLIDRGHAIGILYLENNKLAGAFTKERVEVLSLLCSQAAISLENARLYQESQNYAQTLEETQLQLVQSEKMASIGQLVSGIAHEINNPIGFISGNLDYATESIQDLMDLLQLYEQEFEHKSQKIQQKIEEIELDYLKEDLPESIQSMKEGTKRIIEISKSMRIFSRADTIAKVPFNIHDGLDSTLLILKHRLKANKKRPEIKVVKNYGYLLEINCYPGQLNQVFINLISNAIDALDESNSGKTFTDIKAAPNQITITTEIDSEKQQAIIKIGDNGMGISEEFKDKIFGHLFTTKAVGKGTGLGLSISRKIIEEKHGGKIICNSELGTGTEFVISLPL